MSRATTRQLALVLCAALVVRLAAVFWWEAHNAGRFKFGDSETYWALARTIAQGSDFEYGGYKVFRTPGYPALLAPLFVIGGDNPPVMWGRLVSVLCGTLAVAGVWAWAGRLSCHGSSAFAAALVAAFYPGAIAMSLFVLSEAPFIPLMLAQLILWTVAWQEPRGRRAAWWAIAAGLTAAAAVMMRPSWLLFTPFALAVGLICCPGRTRQLALGAVVLSGLILGMTPWWIRNDLVVGHFVPTTLQVGASLYDGLSPRATGASDMRFVAKFVAQEVRQPAAAGGSVSDPFEYRVDLRMRNAAIAWVKAHPGAAIRLAGVKLRRMWHVWPNEPSLSSRPVRAAVLTTYVPVLLCGLLGAATTARRGWPYVLCLVPAIYFTLLHVVFVSSIRYREPAMLGLVVLAAIFIVERFHASKPLAA